jgi:RNA polymerase sigma factor (sigma-70 family)
MRHSLVNHDTAWLRGIFETHFDEVRNYAYYITGNEDIADRVAHATIIRIWSLRNRLSQNISTALPYSIARGIIRFKYRGAKGASIPLIRQIEISNDGRLVGEEIVNEKVLEKIQSELMELSGNKRSILLMHHIDRLTTTEIAQRLNINTKAAKGLLAEAQYQIAQALQEKL